jgi:MerR family redox-sensitive transcriptional activator SoxR
LRPVLDERIRALAQVRDGMALCVGCGCLSMRQCAIDNAQDALAVTGPGARRTFPRRQPGGGGSCWSHQPCQGISTARGW